MIQIVDYGLGNLRSVQKAIEKIGHDAEIINAPDLLKNATKIIIPGVGAFEKGMRQLDDLGFSDALKEEVLKKGKPFLGICLGMQFLANKSDEHGTDYPGLGMIPGHVKALAAYSDALHSLHIGWSEVTFAEGSPMFTGIKQNSDFYFVHEYFYSPENAEDQAGETIFSKPFTSALIHENIWATQFHPEKSQKVGLKLLSNFCERKE